MTAELPVDVTNEMPSNLRTELYQTKACLFVTTRILVVDLLNSVVQPKQVCCFSCRNKGGICRKP